MSPLRSLVNFVTLTLGILGFVFVQGILTLAFLFSPKADLPASASL